MTRWEYAMLAWDEKMESFSHPAGTGWKTERKLELRRPGADEPETIGKEVYTWTPDKPEWDSVAEGIVKMLEALNKLGAEGWELVSETVRSTAVNSLNGYPTAGRPIILVYIFKRCITG